MDSDERFKLIARNTEEIVTSEELKKLLERKKRPVVYCGYEPSGPLHLGHFVTITKLMDLEKAGFHVKILLADIHALLNKKGREEEIGKEVDSWTRIIKAIEVDAEIVKGSNFEFLREYQFDVMKLAQEVTLQRGLRSMQEVARDVEHASVSQVWYPLMQVVDIKHLQVDVALGGMEQRKIHMMGRDVSSVLGHQYVAIHTPLITSLRGPGQKMSKSIPGSGISVIDSREEIEKTLKGAFCPEKKVEENPILQIAQLIIFPRFSQFEIYREKKFGGDIVFSDYAGLEKAYSMGEVHPVDLKRAVGDYLEKVLGPIRKKF